MIIKIKKGVQYRALSVQCFEALAFSMIARFLKVSLYVMLLKLGNDSRLTENITQRKD